MDNMYFQAASSIEAKQTLRYFKSQVPLIKNSPLELYNLSVATDIFGYFSLSIEILDRILKLVPDWGDIHDLRGRAYWALHDYRNARTSWKKFAEYRKNKFSELKISLNFATIDETFTGSFGNYAFLFPVFLSDNHQSRRRYFYHPHVHSNTAKKKDNYINNNRLISNSAMMRAYSGHIEDVLPSELLAAIAKDNHVTRLPFYCQRDTVGEFAHFQTAWSDRLIAHSKKEEDFGFGNSIFQEDAFLKMKRDLALDPERPIVTLHVRESGYWNRVGDLSNSTKNADVTTYMPTINLLVENGYQVVRLGDATMKKLPTKKYLHDYAHNKKKCDLYDLLLIKSSSFMICTCSGPFQVANILSIPLVATNWVPIHILPFSAKDIVLLKKIQRGDNCEVSTLSFREMLSLDFGEFSYYNLLAKGMRVVDNGPEEIVDAVKLMLSVIDVDSTSTDWSKKIRQKDPTKSLFNFLRKDRFYGKKISSNARILDPLAGNIL